MRVSAIHFLRIRAYHIHYCIIQHMFVPHVWKLSKIICLLLVIYIGMYLCPTMMSALQATIDGWFSPLAKLEDKDADLDSMVTHFNKAVTDTAVELLGKQRGKRKPWVTPEILYLCDQRRDLKKKRGEPEGDKNYRDWKKDQDKDEDGKRDLDTGSMPWSGSMPQKE